MWWECKACVAGGNSDKSMHQHEADYPGHLVSVVQDYSFEE